MARELSERLIQLITEIDKGLAKASKGNVVSVDRLSEEESTFLYSRYLDKGIEIIKGEGEKKYDIRKGQIIDGQTSDSSYCLHIRRKD